MKHSNIANILFVMVCLCCFSCKNEEQSSRILLDGQWKVALDSTNIGESEKWYEHDIQGVNVALPGTLDEAQLGTENTLKPALNNYVLSHLARKYQYIGKAWYQREVNIPNDWQGASTELVLERVIWESSVWVNGKFAGKNNSLVASHNYDLSEQLKPGKNIISICIDNSDQYPLINMIGDKYPMETSREMAHAYTNHTQIKWNGIVGEIAIKKHDKTLLEKIQIYTDLTNRQLAFATKTNLTELKELNYQIKKGVTLIAEGKVNVDVNGNLAKGKISLSDEVKAWDEFNPNIYTLELTAVDGSGKAQQNFGLREIKTEGGTLKLNNQRIFLRGTLECAVFPQTGYPYTNKEDWKKVISTAKSYGLNHFRFHSWCPPAAAFEAADELGFYIQAELPHWSLKVGEDAATSDFLKQEAQRIITAYGNHPSFILMAMGNELEGDFDVLNAMVKSLKSQDNRRLYTTTSFSFQKGAGSVAQPEDEFLVTQWTENGWIRGQGFFNSESPHFDKDYQAEMKHINMPVISHEIGQYSVYPDINEISKYQGVLKPLNFIAIRNDLEQKGLLKYASDFTLASGKLAALLYKEEIERAMKTPAFDGFQLLQLQDFPGQGTALVGLLNVFWESKGAIDNETFSMFNGPVVPLLQFEKAVYKSGETFNAEIQIANFKEAIKDYTINWSIVDGKNVLESGSLNGDLIEIGNQNFVGKIAQSLEVDKAKQLQVKVEIAGTPYKNQWPIWVYPEVDLDAGNVIYTRSYNEAEKLLKQGKKVLLNPNLEDLKGVEGRFVPVFWSPVHFPDQPSTMGILCDTDHPALANFPTEFHSNWQWWDLCINSKSIVLDDVQVDPIVTVVDNFVTNRKLANVFETKIGEGSLVFTSIDLEKNLDDRPVAKQLRKSLVEYMKSDQFTPKQSSSFEDIKSFSSKR
ncbi:sugar-binding domain-containing protein [Chondrinema litorale]|uniref:sugar-binding domain-containing protein n=1 Tax=Chondrinema litorale TaxID=2994555 RepID=UPI002542D1EE|nr:sugar-binding domain-containing protein [Chondrinema litorale]UZR96857.1 glycoside hydrolase family 2 [Chondrinema litorale]